MLNMEFSAQDKSSEQHSSALVSYAFRVQLSFFGSVCEYRTQHSQDIERIAFIFRNFLTEHRQSANLIFYLATRHGRSFLEEIISPGKDFSIFYQTTGQDEVHIWRFPDTPFPPLQVAPLKGRYLVLHGCAMVSPCGRVTVAPAPSLSGKTTLLLECVRRGFKCISDDVLFIDLRTLRVYRYPKPVSIRERSLAFFPEIEYLIEHKKPACLAFLEPEQGTKTWLIHLDDLHTDCYTSEESHEIDFLIIPDRTHPSIQPTQISGSEALLRVVTNTCRSGLEKQEIIAACARLINRTKNYILPIDQLQFAVDQLERLR